MQQHLLRFTSLVCFLLSTTCVYALSDSCPTGDSFSCPACDGTVTIQVKDCLTCDGFLQTDLTHDRCFNRRLFNIGGKNADDNHYHYWWNDIVGAIIWFITAGIAISCGVGGGSVYVPMGMIVLQFAPKPASGLSQASIFGACIGGLILNCRNLHPQEKIRHDPGVGEKRPVQVNFTSKQDEKEYLARGGVFYTRPLINYNMALFLLPLQIGGAVTGVLIQKLLPNWLYLLTSGCLLIMIVILTFCKYRTTAAKEKVARERQIDVSEDNTPQTADEIDIKNKQMNEAGRSSSHTSSDNEHAKTIPVPTLTNENDPNLEARIAFLKKDQRQFPLENILAACVLWCVLIVLNLMIGGRGMESVVGIDCNSFWFAILNVAQYVWMFSFAVYYGWKLLRVQAARNAVQYPFMKDDVAWNFYWIFFYGFWSFMGGAIGGLIGVGGALILGPVLMITGIHPSISTATTASMVVFTSGNVAVMYVISGQVPVSYAIFYFCVCACGAVFGKYHIDAYVKRTERASLLILILSMIITFSTVGCFSIAFSSLANQDWCFDGFKPFCVVSAEGDEDFCAAAAAEADAAFRFML